MQKTSEEILKNLSYERDQILNSKTKKEEEFKLINEILNNKDNLLIEVKKIISKESPKNIETILENHKKYVTTMDEYITKLEETKLELIKCIEYLENKVSDKYPTLLEISINGNNVGRFLNVDYITEYDETHNVTKIVFDLKKITHLIKIIDNDKRYMIVQMMYDQGVKITYNIKFDLKKINSELDKVYGNYTIMR